ncbi:MAG: hypothetical protein ACKO72_04960 [Actinomycetes bacterium]
MCIAVNGVLVTALWFVPWPAIHDVMFSLHHTFWFPIELASWLIAGVPSTNQLAPDRCRVLPALDDEAAIDRLLRAKHVALWTITTPITLLAALFVGIITDDWVTMVVAVVWVASAPLCAIGIACSVGVRWPYHELPLRTRWRLRSRGRTMLVRWGVLVVLPYGLVPALAIIGLVPSAVAGAAAHLAGADRRGVDAALLGGLVVAIPLTLGIWHRATARAARATVRRAEALRAYLEDPRLG